MKDRVFHDDVVCLLSLRSFNKNEFPFGLCLNQFLLSISKINESMIIKKKKCFVIYVYRYTISVWKKIAVSFLFFCFFFREQEREKYFFVNQTVIVKREKKFNWERLERLGEEEERSSAYHKWGNSHTHTYTQQQQQLLNEPIVIEKIGRKKTFGWRRIKEFEMWGGVREKKTWIKMERNRQITLL
jgi:hypothetical protein